MPPRPVLGNPPARRRHRPAGIVARSGTSIDLTCRCHSADSPCTSDASQALNRSIDDHSILGVIRLLIYRIIPGFAWSTDSTLEGARRRRDSAPSQRKARFGLGPAHPHLTLTPRRSNEGTNMKPNVGNWAYSRYRPGRARYLRPEGQRYLLWPGSVVPRGFVAALDPKSRCRPDQVGHECLPHLLPRGVRHGKCEFNGLGGT
jgi:hypothetical protein